MKIAIVSPYSWSYPGGVVQHIIGLRNFLVREGHEVIVFAPYDPNDRLTRFRHAGAKPQDISLPDYVESLGRTISLSFNGSQSNLSLNLRSAIRLHKRLSSGEFDIVHIHEPVAPLISMSAMFAKNTSIIGTYHAYSTNPIPHAFANFFGARWMMSRLSGRIAVSSAAAWTASTFFDGEYTVIPNGIDISNVKKISKTKKKRTDILFIGQSIPRKGLPVLLQAFGELRRKENVRLTIIGATKESLQASLDLTDVRILGKVDDVQKKEELSNADILCVPSTGNESFGIVLLEGMAAGLTVVASDIPGYRDIVKDKVNGRQVPPADPTALNAVLRELIQDKKQQSRLSKEAVKYVKQYSWDNVAKQIVELYEHVLEKKTENIPMLINRSDVRQQGSVSMRKVFQLAIPIITMTLIIFAFRKIHLHQTLIQIENTSILLTIVALLIMSSSMFVRAVSWLYVLKEAFTDKISFATSFNAIAVGVFLSATSPLRLGEVARAIVLSRHIEHPIQSLPKVAGTILSQTVMNILALIILGTSLVVIASTHFDYKALTSGLITSGALILIAAVTIVVAMRQRRLNFLRDSAKHFLSGFHIFKSPLPAARATGIQLLAWAIQTMSCYTLLLALHIHTSNDFYAAAAVLFAVNVTAIVPLTPSNLGPFQAACVAILSGIFGVNTSQAVAYGLLLQLVEFVTAISLGAFALQAEGMSRRTLLLESRNTSLQKT